jgi:serine/threonine protein kinase
VAKVRSGWKPILKAVYVDRQDCSISVSLPDAETEKKIAVKTIYYTNSKNADKVIQDFQRECESLQSLPHPSIVRFLGFSHHPDMRQAVLRMEWAAFELSESGRADLGDIISSYDDKRSYRYLPEIFLWHVLFHLGAALALCHHGIELKRTQVPARVNSEDVLLQLIPNPSNELISLASKNTQVTWSTEQIEFSIKDSHETIVHRDIKPSNG